MGAGVTIDEARYRIGEVAKAAGVSTRTLRYYEELGLVSPSGHSPGGARRYSENDLARVLRIRELQQLVGFNLDEIKTIVAGEARLDELRSEFRDGGSPQRERELVAEAIEINDRLREQVRQKVSRIGGFLEELDAKAVRYRQIVEEIEKCPAGRPE
jgi:MerR family transcriptional regulator, repressor of the yfmOP operon